jgi:hypothetical protein
MQNDHDLPVQKLRFVEGGARNGCLLLRHFHLNFEARHFSYGHFNSPLTRVVVRPFT